MIENTSGIIFGWPCPGMINGGYHVIGSIIVYVSSTGLDWNSIKIIFFRISEV